MGLINSGHTFVHGVTCAVIDQHEGEKQQGKHGKYKKKGVRSFSARFLDWSLTIWQLVDTQAAGADSCLVQMLHLSASSGIYFQETHICGFILYIPFMGQGYKDLLP